MFAGNMELVTKAPYGAPYGLYWAIRCRINHISAHKNAQVDFSDVSGGIYLFIYLFICLFAKIHAVIPTDDKNVIAGQQGTSVH